MKLIKLPISLTVEELGMVNDPFIKTCIFHLEYRNILCNVPVDIGQVYCCGMLKTRQDLC
jgi:hypothetical protein